MVCFHAPGQFQIRIGGRKHGRPTARRSCSIVSSWWSGALAAKSSAITAKNNLAVIVQEHRQLFNHHCSWGQRFNKAAKELRTLNPCMYTCLNRRFSVFPFKKETLLGLAAAGLEPGPGIRMSSHRNCLCVDNLRRNFNETMPSRPCGSSCMPIQALARTIRAPEISHGQHGPRSLLRSRKQRRMKVVIAFNAEYVPVPFNLRHLQEPSELLYMALHCFHYCFDRLFFIVFRCVLIAVRLEAQGVKERKLAGWGLSRGKAWKGSLNVTEKNAPQMEANTAIMEDAPAMKLFSSCCTWSRSRQPKWNGSCKTSKLCILPGFHSPVVQKTL